MEQAAIFEKIYQDYLADVAELDLPERAGRLGIQTEGDTAVIPLLGTSYRVSPAGVTDPECRRPLHAVSVVLCKYLLLCPETVPQESDWVAYRDFMDATPFVGGFSTNTEQAIAKNFTNAPDALVEAFTSLGGTPAVEDVSYDVSMRVDALPRVPLLMLYNDADEEFSAQCSVLFERRAEKYLDMECLAIVGWLLSDFLMQARGVKVSTIM